MVEFFGTEQNSHKKHDTHAQIRVSFKRLRMCLERLFPPPIPFFDLARETEEKSEQEEEEQEKLAKLEG